MAQSILTKEVVETILETAKNNLERDGHLCPALFLHLTDGQRLVCSLQLPQKSQEKPAYFTHIGQSLKREGKIVEEAILVVEGWFVQVKHPSHDLAVPPSEHPRRQEAIVIIGRDSGKTRNTSVVLVFTRDRQGKPEWQPITMAQYNEPADSGQVPVGLLDYFFVEKAVDQPTN